MFNISVHTIKINSGNRLGWIKKKIFDITQNHSFFLWLYVILLSVSLIPYYKNSQIVLGGEGNYWVDFSSVVSQHGSAWQSFGTGFISTSLNFVGLNIYFFIMLEKVLHNVKAINFILIFLIYFLPFFAIFKVCKELRASPFISFIISLFYIVNPFSLYFLMALNQWNTMALFVLPTFFLIIFKYYRNNFKLFFYFGFTSFVFAFTNANPPLMVVYQISIVLSTIVISYYNKATISKLFKKYAVLISSFVLFNAWWIANWFFVYADAKKILTIDFALSWLQEIGSSQPIIWQVFTFTTLLIPPGRSNFFLNYYTNILSFFIILIPIIILGYFLITHRPKQKHILFLMTMLIAIFFLAKGVQEPFGGIYKYLVLNFPGFNIFKSSTEKWGVLYLFIFTLLLIFIIIEFKKDKYYKLIISFFLIYLIFASIPFITSNFIPDNKIGPGYQSRNYIDKIEYQHLREQLNSDKIEYRVLSLPGSLNYQVLLHNNGDKYYSGMDPVLSNTNKPFIAAYTSNNMAIDILYTNISSPNYTKILALFNIKKIVINKDMVPWFGFKEKENTSELEKIFDTSMLSKKDGSIIVYDNQNYFLPRIYPSISPILINGSINEMFNVATSNNFTSGNNVFFILDQTNKSKLAFLQKYKPENSAPNITFQKINPAKYRFKVENASHPFFLVFSESYHSNWKAYIDGSFKFNEIIEEYNNTGVKEARHSMNLFEFGDISYYFKKPIDDDKHFLVNGYANAWYIDNLGSYDVTIYYWPQIIFYGGLAISLLSFFASLGYFIQKWKKRKA